MREHNRLFKCYCSENNPTCKEARHSKYKNAQNFLIFKVKKSENNINQSYFQKHSKNVLKKL